MEIVPFVPAKQYQFRVSDDPSNTVFILDELILPYFRSLYDLIQDLGEAKRGEVIPIIAPELTLSDMQVLLAFYRFYAQGTGNQWAFSSLERLRNADSTLWSYWYDVSEKSDVMIHLARIANFLNVAEVLVFVMDLLLTYYYQKPTSELALSYEKLKKRKINEVEEPNLVEELKKQHPLPIRVSYLRALYIQRILETRLPCDLAPGVDLRLPALIRPIVSGRESLMIRTVDTLYVAGDNFFSNMPQEKRANITLRESSSWVLNGNNHTEMAMGNASSAILSHGSLLLYGIYAPGYGQISLDLRPHTIAEEVIAVWQGNDYIVVQTPHGLYSWGKPGPHLGHRGSGEEPQRIEGVKSKDVIDVACGDSHTLVLTKQGLYGCGNNAFDVLGSPYLANAVFYDLVLLAPDLNVSAIACSDYHSLLLTQSGELWGTGDNFSHQLGIDFNAEQWQRLLPEDFAHTITQIYAFPYYSLIVTSDSSLYGCGSNYNDELGFPNITIVREWTRLSSEGHVMGEILSVASLSKALLVGTTKGIYVNSASVSFLSLFEIASPHTAVFEKLPIAFNYHERYLDVEKQGEEGEVCEPESKRIRYHCSRPGCYAEAHYVHENSTLLCSKYCLMKQLL